MDDFVALTERYSLKPRGKSAPMAALKRSGFNHNSVKASPFDSGDNANADDESSCVGVLFTESIPGFGGSGQPNDLESLFIPGPRSSSVPTYSWGSPVASAQFLDDFLEANVIDDMNNRDRQIQIEQEERSRISENLDAEIKLWAAGKEGNLRALISSLLLVLWPGSGWEAVSLTDLIDHICSSQESL
ncbi:hypothetical protein Bca101_057281 [Brassica carinata]